MEFEFDGDRFRAGEVTFDEKTIEALTLAGSPGGAVSAPVLSCHVLRPSVAREFRKTLEIRVSDLSYQFT